MLVSGLTSGPGRVLALSWFAALLHLLSIALWQLTEGGQASEIPPMNHRAIFMFLAVIAISSCKKETPKPAPAPPPQAAKAPEERKELPAPADVAAAPADAEKTASGLASS